MAASCSKVQCDKVAFKSSNATASRSSSSFSTKAAKPSASAASQRLSNLEVSPAGELLKEVWWGLSPSLRGRAGVGLPKSPLPGEI